jgi:arylsulfate sulfotransferase
MRSFPVQIAILLASAITGCSHSSDPPDPFTNGNFSVKSISFSTGELETAFDPGVNHYQFQSFLVDPAGRITIDATGVRRLVVQGVERTPGPQQSLQIATLSQSSAIDIELDGANGATLSYRFQVLPPDLPAYEVTATNPIAGRILMTAYASGTTPAGRSFLLVLDEMGKVLGFRSNLLPVADFQQQTLTTGTVRYTFCDYDPLIFTVKESTGHCYVLDTGLRKIAEIKGVVSPVNPKGLLDHHDLVLLEDDHYIVAANVTKVVNNIPASLTGGVAASRTVVPSILQEVKAGRAIFEWDGSAFPEFYTAAVLDGNFADPAGLPDYMHFNSIQVDTDGNLIASFRNVSQVVKINRSTGAILWRLGGPNSDFPLATGQRSSAQHFARRNADGTISLHDNGNLNTPQVTRGLSYRLDESRKVVTDFRAAGYQGIFSVATGSTQFLPGNRMFTNWGVVDSAIVDVSEIDPDTQVAQFTLRFTAGNYFSYRAIKIPR